MMASSGADYREAQESLTRLAELLQFRERFADDPRATLEAYGLHGVPDEAIEAISALSPDELGVFARVQEKLGDMPIGAENCLLF